MKIYFQTLLIGLSLVACESGNKKSEYTKIMDQITDKYLKVVISNNNFILLGQGGGMRGTDVQHISLLLKTHQDLDIPQVRELMVNLEEQYLEILNGTDEVKPFLKDFFVDSRIFQLGIIFVSYPTNNFVLPPYIANAEVIAGKILYRHYNKEKKKLENIFSESYEEAYKIVYGHEKVLKRESSSNFLPEESQASK